MSFFSHSLKMRHHFGIDERMDQKFIKIDFKSQFSIDFSGWNLEVGLTLMTTLWNDIFQVFITLSVTSSRSINNMDFESPFIHDWKWRTKWVRKAYFLPCIFPKISIRNQKRGFVNLLVYFSSQKIKRIESALDRYPQFFGEKLESELIGYFISKA